MSDTDRAPLFYPSFEALYLAGHVMAELGGQTPGYQGRVGAAWYWRLPAGIIVRMWLDYTVTEERWDVVRAQASTPNGGIFDRADFPFAAYATTPTSPPFIHDMQGAAEWSNRLYFQMGDLIEDMGRWINALHAVALSPQVSPPASFPALNDLERRLVRYAVDELDGRFIISRLHEAFKDEVSRSRVSSMAHAWERGELLTEPPRRVTYALRLLAEEGVTAPQPEA